MNNEHNKRTTTDPLSGNVRIINHKTGAVSELGKRSWEQNKLSMPDWKLYGEVEEPIKIKGIKEILEAPVFTEENKEATKTRKKI